MKNYLRLARPWHYIKNLLIFLPLIFGGKLLNLRLFLYTLLGCAAFSLMASAVYVINDLRDAEKDRHHPKKCHRPIASGAVSPRQATVFAALLIAGAGVLNWLAVGFGPRGWVLLLLYLGVNFAYSFGLKDMPILDIAILVSGFLIRVLYGSAITSIPVSSWLYLTVMSVSFYMGLGKRRNELKRQTAGGKAPTRKVLEQYSYNFLDKNMYLCLALTITFYALWSVDSATLAAHAGAPLVWTVPLVILICMKYSLTVESESDGDPVEVLFGDILLLALCAIYGISMLVLLYLF